MLASTRCSKMTPLLLDPSRVPVLLWVPNLIGYLRVAALIAAIRQPDAHGVTATRLLFVSFALDYFDGPAARALNMCSTFGDLLDHVTDHATMMWLVYLTSSSPLNVWLNAACNGAALVFMAVQGHYFKHATGNAITRLVESNNYWNLWSLLWAANTIIVPFVKLGYHGGNGLAPTASNELLDFAGALRGAAAAAGAGCAIICFLSHNLLPGAQTSWG